MFVLLGRHARIFFELRLEVTLRRKVEIHAYLKEGMVGVANKSLRFENLLLHYVVGKRHSRFFLELGGEIRTVHFEHIRDVVHEQALIDIFLDIGYRAGD